MKKNTNQPTTNTPEKVSSELRLLVDEFLANKLNRSDFARLEELLEADQANRDYYILASSIESLIPVVSDRMIDPIEMQSVPVREKPSGWLVAAALITLLAGAASVFFMRAAPPSSVIELAESQPAVLDDTINVVWTDGHGILEMGQEIDRRVEIDAGVIQLRYANGVTLIIEGPASFEVTGINSGKLNFGSLVADVPSAGKGFVLDYGDERLVDHGTKFGVKLLDKGETSEIAVFKGEIEIFLKDGRSTRMIEGHAVQIKEGDIRSIPVEKERFLRELPSREFPWKMPLTAQGSIVEMEFDVSRLVTSEGEYRCVFKWMHGEDRLLVNHVQLWCDDVLVSEDIHKGSTGELRHTFDNIYTLNIRTPIAAGSIWKLKSKMRTASPSDGLPQIAQSEGVVQFHSMPQVKVSKSAYIGKWGYWHDGVGWIREFNEDGTMILYRNGVNIAHGEWNYENDFLEVFFPATEATERVYLRQANRLVFVERPFSDARRID